MITYSIKDLEKLSGIKAHTIRIWEQRYGLITPQRTQTNIRFYTDEDLKYILNIAFLNKNGLRISQIAKMKRGDIASKVNTISQDNFENINQIQTLTMAMMELDKTRIEQIISNRIAQSGYEDVILKLLIPFLEKISLLWLTGAVGLIHEQFVHNIIRQKILAATENWEQNHPAAEPKAKFLLYLAPTEELEVVLMLLQYLLTIRNIEVVYLGTKISLNDLSQAHKMVRPQYVLTMLSEQPHKSSIAEYLSQLSSVCSESQILLTGYQAIHNPLPEEAQNIQIFEDFLEMVEFFDGVGSLG